MGSTEEHAWAPESEDIKLEFIADGILERKIPGIIDRLKTFVHQTLESRRYQSRDREPDYERRLRELEGQLDRENPGFRMTVNNSEGGDKKSWKDWILLIVGLLIVGWLTRLDNKLDDIADLRAQQKLLEIRQNQTAKHLESTDGRIEKIESH
jgi:hypothetical protein